MAVYLIVEATKVIDKAKYGTYIQKVPQTIERFGGEYVARGGQVHVVSGDWHPSRLIIVKFASMDRFNSWWGSCEYRAIAPLREEAASTNAIVVEGV